MRGGLEPGYVCQSGLFEMSAPVTVCIIIISESVPKTMINRLTKAAAV